MGKRGKGQRLMRSLRKLEYERCRREYAEKITRILLGEFEVGDRVHVAIIPDEKAWCYSQYSAARRGKIIKVMDARDAGGVDWAHNFYDDGTAICITFDDTGNTAWARPDMLERID